MGIYKSTLRALGNYINLVILQLLNVFFLLINFIKSNIKLLYE